MTGPTLAALAMNSKPEAIIPLDQLGGMGGRVTVVLEPNSRQFARIARVEVDSVTRNNPAGLKPGR